MPAEIEPLLITPPVLLLPKTTTLVRKIPQLPAEMVPPLLIPPTNVPLGLPPTSMPKLPAEMTPVLPMPPPTLVFPKRLKPSITTIPLANCAVMLPPLPMPPAKVAAFSTRMPD